MRIVAIVLFILAVVSVVVTAAQMSQAFHAPTPNAALLANEISLALLFPVAGALCFLASVALFIVDLVLRSRPTEPTHPPE